MSKLFSLLLIAEIISTSGVALACGGSQSAQREPAPQAAPSRSEASAANQGAPRNDGQSAPTAARRAARPRASR